MFYAYGFSKTDVIVVLTLEIALPNMPLSEAYYACRYACLREPLGFPIGAERLEDDSEAIHAWWETDEGEVVAVGRIHRIPDDSDGAQSDHAGPVSYTHLTLPTTPYV